MEDLLKKTLKNVKAFLQSPAFLSKISYLMIFVYPTRKINDMFFGFVLKLYKIISPNAAGVSSILYGHYFNSVLTAKNQRKDLTQEINIKDLGAAFNLANTVRYSSFLLQFLFFFVGMFLIPGAVYALLGKVLPLKIIVSLATALPIWYMIVSFIMLSKFFKEKPDQQILKTYIAKDFGYLYAKSAEIDEEVAEIAIEQVISSMLLKREDEYEKRIKTIKTLLGDM
jgi:hypothetical protein